MGTREWRGEHAPDKSKALCRKTPDGADKPFRCLRFPDPAKDSRTWAARLTIDSNGLSNSSQAEIAGF